MKKATLITLIVLVLGAALLFAPVRVVSIGDGSFPLQVNVSSAAGPLRSVTCVVCFNRVQAQMQASDLLHVEGYVVEGYVTKAEPFDGHPFLVYVPVTVRESRWEIPGLVLSNPAVSRHQWEFLVVIGKFQDGSQQVKIVEIPDGRETTILNVSLP